MDTTRDIAIGILNEANLCSEPGQKVRLIAQLTELVVRKEPGLLPEILPGMAQMLVDGASGVRRALAGFLSAGAPVNTHPATLALAATQVGSLLQDPAPSVVKAGCAAALGLLRMGLALLAVQPQGEGVAAAWSAVHQLALAACGLLTSHSGEGARVTAVKLVEAVVLLFTADGPPAVAGVPIPVPPPKLPEAVVLGQEAGALMMSLLQLLQRDVVKASSGPVSLVAIKSVAAIAVARPSQMGRVLTHLLALAKDGGFRATSADDASSRPGSALSIGNALRTALSAILRSRSDTSIHWRDRVVEAMQALGAGPAAEAALKYIQRQDYKDAKSRPHPGASASALGGSLPGQPDAKRPRLDGPAPQQQAQPAYSQPLLQPQPQANTQPATGWGLAAGAPQQPTFTAPPPAYPAPAGGWQQPIPAPQPPQLPAGMPSLGAPPVQLPLLAPAPAGPLGASSDGAAVPASAADALVMHPLTPQHEMLQVHAVLPALLANPDPTLLPNFLDALAASAPVLLADLVIAIMMAAPPPTYAQVSAAMEQLSAQDAEKVRAREGTPPPAAGAAAQPASQGPSGSAAAAGVGRGTSPAPGVPPPPPGGGPPAGSGPRKGVARHLPQGSCAVPADLPPTPAQAAQVAGSAAGAQAARGAAAQGASVLAAIAPPRLSAHALSGLRASAVRRVAQATAGLPSHALVLRERLLARLATAHDVEQMGSSGDGSLGQGDVAGVALEAAVASIVEGRGNGLAVKWLSDLLAAHARHVYVDSVQQQQQPAEGTAGHGAASGTQVDGKGEKKGEDELMDGHEEGPDFKAQVKGEAEEAGMKGEAKGEGVGAGGATQPQPPPELQLELSLEGSAYETTLLAMLEELRSRDLHAAVRSLLAEAPVFTATGVLPLLGQLIAAGGEWATAGLGAAREALLERPALRQPLLQLVLAAASDTDPSTRSKAVRLLCNQLCVLPGVGELVRNHARAALDSLLVPPPGGGEWEPGEAGRHCELYATLCVRNHELLPGLMAAYAHATDKVRAALLSASESLASALGHSNPQLVALVASPPAGAEPLVLHMLEVLMGSLLPSEQMLGACRARYAATGDASVLAPVVAALSKGEVVGLLPQLLQVQGQAPHALKALFRKLAVASAATGEPLFSPAEMLVALHALDPARDAVPARALITAVDVALHTPDVFPQQAVATAVQQMEAQTPLPLLFMRTVITALKAAPTLRPFIADLLSRLVSRSIWLDRNQWRGFVMLVENNGRAFFPVLLQLPVPVLERLLAGCAPGLPPPANPAAEPALKRSTALTLAAWSTSAECKQQVLRPVASLLERVVSGAAAEQEALRRELEARLAAAAGASASAGAASASAAPAGEAGAAADGAKAAGVEQAPAPEQAAAQAPGTADSVQVAAPSGTAGTAGVVEGIQGGGGAEPEPGPLAAAEANDGDTVMGEAEEDADAAGVGAGEGGQGEGDGVSSAGASRGSSGRQLDEFDLDFDDEGNGSDAEEGKDDGF